MLRCDQRQNLGEQRRQQSMSVGVAAGGIALGWALFCAQFGLMPRLGWLVVLPAAVCIYFLISGSLGICIFHSLRGDRGTDYGREAVLDRTTREQLRLRAIVAVSASLALAVAFAAVLVTGSH